ncbi:MAG: DoxX family protein [Terracidiphilus sp.]|jgi:uncharacterized membrane protein
MNNLDWFVQVLLAGVFLFAGLRTILGSQWRAKAPHPGQGDGSFGLPRNLAYGVAVLEIAGALALIVPANLWPPDVIQRLAAAGLALLTLAVFIYQVRRKQQAAPVMALFLLALFVVVARWP